MAGEEKGVLTLDELRACGMSRTAVKRRARRGLLHRLHQGVYAVGHRALPKEAEWLGVVKACGPGAVLSHFSAAALWGLVNWDWRRPEVTVPATRRPRQPGIRIHQSEILTRRDWRIHDGIPVTTPAWTILDLASQMPYKRLRRIVREAQGSGLVSIRELVDVLARAGRRRGTRNLARIVADGFTPTESVLSDVVLDLILAGGFERPDVSKPLVIEGRRVVPDFRWLARRLIVEADGAAWHHGNRVGSEDDAERQAVLEAHGEHVIRVTWDQAVTKREQTWARFRAAGAPLASNRH
jgi:very-short-patch-repair endonuclease